MSDNIIIGPWGSNQKIYPEDTAIDDLADDLTFEVYDALRDYGYDNCDDSTLIKDLAMINEAIRSYAMKLAEKHHPLQDVSERFFDIMDDGTLIINNYIEVEFDFE